MRFKGGRKRYLKFDGSAAERYRPARCWRCLAPVVISAPALSALISAPVGALIKGPAAGGLQSLSRARPWRLRPLHLIPGLAQQRGHALGSGEMTGAHGDEEDVLLLQHGFDLG